jgi:predicted outer membrane repeat protein
MAGPASADTVTVTNTADDGSATSLRGVLENAAPGTVVVLTTDATYQLTRCVTTVEGSPGAGDIEIPAEVTIQGNGATIQQTCEDRVLYTQSPITIEDVTITGGFTDGPGGGLFQDSDSQTTLTDVTFTGNQAATGGGVETSGGLTITGGFFEENEARQGSGGGVHVVNPAAGATISGTAFVENHSDQWGGGMEVVNRSEAEATAVDTYVLSIDSSTFAGNTADSDGGGGLDTEIPADITVTNSWFTGNHSGQGGGIGTFGTPTTLQVSGSTFDQNDVAGRGGAILVSGSAEELAEGDSSLLQLTNSTLTGNREGTQGAVNVTGTAQLSYVTMTDNTTRNDVAENAVGRDSVSTQAVVNAANLAADQIQAFASVVTGPQGGPNCVLFGGSTVDSGYQFSDDTSCGFTATTSNVHTPNDPVLGALGDNGGPTQTRLPLTGSPLIDAVPTTVCEQAGILVDQRGITRPQGGGCEIGAVEVAVAGPTPTPTPSPAVVVTPRFTG